ncbi:hypothetical protein JCM6882_006093 [Rhodosporidiobolus microsporus]
MNPATLPPPPGSAEPTSASLALAPIGSVDLPTTPAEPDSPGAVELKASSIPATPCQHRVHPSTRSPAPVVRPFSVCDNAASAFLSFSFTKVFPPALPGAQDPFNSSLLSASLAHVLSAYPHFAGKLRLARADDVGRPYQKRYGRVWVEYGAQSDPGVSFTFVQRKDLVKSILPKEVGERVSDFGALFALPILPDGGEIVELRASPTDRPALAIRVTRFSDGAAVFGVRIAHALADATTLNRFIADWSDIHRALLLAGSISTIPLPSRPFDPEALDAHAAGDLDSPFPDPAVEAQYRLLGRLEYDLWARPELHPPGMVQSSAPHSSAVAEDAARGGERGEPAPWSTWDVSAPVVVRAVQLSAEEVQRIWRRAQALLDASAGTGDSVKITAHDAVVAHLWRLSTRARNLPPATTLSIIPVINVRSRVSPPLALNSSGCPTFFSCAQVDSNDILSPAGLSIAASSLRQAIQTATPSTISALLRHNAYELDPLRMLDYFGGSTHLTVSSWLRSGAYSADFGTGTPLCARGMVMPADGLFLLDDVAAEAWEGQRWWERGAMMQIWLKEDVMERMLADPELRG